MNKPHKRKLRNFLISLAIIVSILIILWRVLFLIHFKAPQPQSFGVTFSQKQAVSLGLDWKETYLAILDDLNVKNLRLIAYWDLIEKSPGEYDFSDLDFQMDQAASHHAKVILAIGRRVPRWPECHIPNWALGENADAQNADLNRYLTTIVNRYKNNSSLFIWQVENEHFLEAFGVCPPRDKGFLIKEIALVKSLDPNHLTMVTDSGELATWLRTRNLADYLGTSAYRIVYNPMTGYVNYGPLIPHAYYRLKAWLIKKPIDKIIVSELQAEPWTPKSLAQTSFADQAHSMSFAQFQKNIQFGKDIGFQYVYLWGVEWWYYLKSHGHPEFWQEAKTLFQ